MADLCEVFVIDVRGIVPFRDTKYCVCVSVARNKYVLIDTQHREMYDDFQISAKKYDFLKGIDRYVSCSAIYEFDNSRIKNIDQVIGVLQYDDMKKIIEKIRNSKVIKQIDKDSVLPELEEWLLDNS